MCEESQARLRIRSDQIRVRLEERKPSQHGFFTIRIFFKCATFMANMDYECKNDKIWRGCIATGGQIQMDFVTQVHKYSFP